MRMNYNLCQTDRLVIREIIVINDNMNASAGFNQCFKCKVLL